MNFERRFGAPEGAEQKAVFGRRGLVRESGGNEPRVALSEEEKKQKEERLHAVNNKLQENQILRANIELEFVPVDTPIRDRLDREDPALLKEKAELERQLGLSS